VRLWPADPGELPTVEVFAPLALEGDEIDWRGTAKASATIPVDFVLRELREVALDDDSALRFLEMWGLSTPHVDGRWSLRAEVGCLLELQRLSRHVLAYRTGVDVRVAWVDLGKRTPQSEGQAWEMWTRGINRHLRGFQMHVVADFGEGQTSRGWDLDLRRPTLAEVAAQQLALLASGGEEVLHCANDHCGRPFTRQRGRARYGEGHSSGVLYCSNLCARAQAERNRRARRAAERKASQS
jgi:hypothetical protein